MKIINLTASNVKRLKAVEITPDGAVQIIGGRNAQGKSSVLDAIWLALGGGVAAKDTTRPIRDGEDRASVTLDLGEFKITRTWTHSGTQLKVENADGARYSSPQGILDALVGKLAFDPLGFTRLSSKDQVKELLALVDLPLDLDANAAERKRAFDERTEVGRLGKALGEVPAIDESLPEVEVSASDLIQEIRDAQRLEQEAKAAQDSAHAARTAAAHLRDQIAELQSRLAEVDALIVAEDNRMAVLPEPKDVAALEAQLEQVEDQNAAIRANNITRERSQKRDEYRAQYDALTAKIAGLDKAKTDALAQAEFPIEGLSFDENGVTFQGVPLGQASSAEQIRVSLAIAMALNPKLRVLRIADGSLLDQESLALISETVTANDFQLWIERVGNADEGAVIIEDGEIANA